MATTQNEVYQLTEGSDKGGWKWRTVRTDGDKVEVLNESTTIYQTEAAAERAMLRRISGRVNQFKAPAAE